MHPELHKRRHETWMRYSVIFFLVCRKEHFQRNDMNIIIGFTKLPEAVRHTAYGADVILIFVKRSVLCGVVLLLLVYCDPNLAGVVGILNIG